MKTTEIYTIQRLYFEAKALLEKHNYVIADHILEVEFELHEHHKEQPRLLCSIDYHHTDYREKENNVYSFRCSSPALALSAFEIQILVKTGNTLAERIGAEIS